MSETRKRLGVALGLLYHNVAQPLAGLALLSGNKEARGCAEWLLSSIVNASQELAAKESSNGGDGGDSASQVANEEALKPFRNEEGEIRVRGFLPERATEQRTTEQG